MHPYVKVSIAGAAAFAVAAWASLAQAQEIKRTEIKRSDLTGTNMEVIMTVLEACLSGWLPIRCVGDNGREWIPEAFRRRFQSFSEFSQMTQPVRDIWSICAGQTVSPVRNA